MSKCSVGNAFQDWIAKHLRKTGWDVANFKTFSKQLIINGKMHWTSQRQDVFGCDIIAIKHKQPILFIQASLSGAVKKRLKEFQKYNFPKKHCIIQLWIKREDGRISVKELINEQLIDVGQFYRGKFYARKEEK